MTVRNKSGNFPMWKTYFPKAFEILHILLILTFSYCRLHLLTRMQTQYCKAYHTT